VVDAADMTLRREEPQLVADDPPADLEIEDVVVVETVAAGDAEGALAVGAPDSSATFPVMTAPATFWASARAATATSTSATVSAQTIRRVNSALNFDKSNLLVPITAAPYPALA
jgi:hypothetical protein